MSVLSSAISQWRTVSLTLQDAARKFLFAACSLLGFVNLNHVILVFLVFLVLLLGLQQARNQTNSTTRQLDTWQVLYAFA
jgi:hypothetical protein